MALMTLPSCLDETDHIWQAGLACCRTDLSKNIEEGAIFFTCDDRLEFGYVSEAPGLETHCNFGQAFAEIAE